MGGAAAILASPPLQADAFVLEMVYPTIDDAVTNRLTMRLGSWARVWTPLLVLQLNTTGNRQKGAASNRSRAAVKFTETLHRRLR